jgi:hypothetical protein
MDWRKRKWNSATNILVFPLVTLVDRGNSLNCGDERGDHCGIFHTVTSHDRTYLLFIFIEGILLFLNMHVSILIMQYTS